MILLELFALIQVVASPLDDLRKTSLSRSMLSDKSSISSTCDFNQHHVTLHLQMKILQ
jgi:hypothetical protein